MDLVIPFVVTSHTDNGHAGSVTVVRVNDPQSDVELAMRSLSSIKGVSDVTRDGMNLRITAVRGLWPTRAKADLAVARLYNSVR